jgi:Domain of Unknown Function (DUF928)
MYQMSGFKNRVLSSLALILLLAFVVCQATATSAPNLVNSSRVNTQNTNSPRKPSPSRRPLPKPPSGPRGFEKYSGKDSSSRLIAAAATRETINPRRPVAPLEGRAYDARPLLAWEIAPGSKTYHLKIYDGDRDKDPSVKTVFESDVNVSEMLYPQNAPALTPGKLYSWNVSTPTVTGTEEGVVARFVILTGAEAAEVRTALASAGLSNPKTAADRLDQARVFENYGVWYDALRIASELAQNPNDKDALAYYEALLEKLEPKPE